MREHFDPNTSIQCVAASASEPIKLFNHGSQMNTDRFGQKVDSRV
jgi:hypothetical protein